MKKKLKIILSSGLIAIGTIIPNASVICAYSDESNNQRKVAYITIDDGPSKYTESIINILNKHNAKATFFMIDRNMKNYPDQVKNIIENGNTAGFHTVSHDINELYKNCNSAKEEFDTNMKTFYEITGMESKLVRLPYGSKPYTPSKSYENLVEAGYKLWDWNIDTEDWKFTSNKIIQNVKDYTKNKDKVVILIHEKQQTVEALDKIVVYLISEGYELLPIDENQKPQNFWSDNLNQ